MKKEVVVFVCDNCQAPGDPVELTKELKKVKVFFPLGWVGLLRLINEGSAKKLLLCADCDKAIDKALAQRRQRNK